MNNVAVLKFGGTSVKSISRIQHVAEIIASQAGRKCVVVVSAMGDTTDHLYKMAKQCCTHPNKRELDLLLSTGEQVSISLLTLALQSRGIRSKSFTGAQIGIFTDNVHNSARIKDINAERIRQALNEFDVVVVAGFQGLSADGEVTTLGRGGSDTTAVALAAACGAPICDIYTDVDGVYTADPNSILDAKLLNTISYDEILEMARNGAQVLHPRSIELAQNYGITVRVRNTFKPDHQGTAIKGEKEVEISHRASGVAVDGNQGCITISGVPAKLAASRKITELLISEGITVDTISQVVDERADSKDILISIKYADVDQVDQISDALKELCSARSVKAETNISRISLIGFGLSNDPQLAADLVADLEDGGIAVTYLSTSEMRISCFVPTHQASTASQLLHRKFIAAETIQFPRQRKEEPRKQLSRIG